MSSTLSLGAGTVSVTDTAASQSLGGSFKNGYILNAGSVTAIVYPNLSAVDATQAIYIPAGAAVDFEDIEIGAIQSFLHKTASSTTTLYYNFQN